MNEQPQFISEQCVQILKECLSKVFDTYVRELLIELITLRTIRDGFKASLPPGAMDKLLEQVRHSEDTKRRVEAQLQPRLEFVQSLSASNLNQILGFLRGDEQKGPLQ